MIARREMRNPAPRANAESRANIDRNETHHTSDAPETEENFAALYLARRYRLALPVAQTIAALANLGSACWYLAVPTFYTNIRGGFQHTPTDALRRQTQGFLRFFRAFWTIVDVLGWFYGAG